MALADPCPSLLLRTDSLTGSNLLEADFFSAHDPSAELIADFIARGDTGGVNDHVGRRVYRCIERRYRRIQGLGRVSAQVRRGV